MGDLQAAAERVRRHNSGDLFAFMTNPGEIVHMSKRYVDDLHTLADAYLAMVPQLERAERMVADAGTLTANDMELWEAEIHADQELHDLRQQLAAMTAERDRLHGLIVAWAESENDPGVATGYWRAAKAALRAEASRPTTTEGKNDGE